VHTHTFVNGDNPCVFKLPPNTKHLTLSHCPQLTGLENTLQHLTIQGYYDKDSVLTKTVDLRAFTVLTELDISYNAKTVYLPRSLVKCKIENAELLTSWIECPLIEHIELRDVTQTTFRCPPSIKKVHLHSCSIMSLQLGNIRTLVLSSMNHHTITIPDCIVSLTTTKCHLQCIVFRSTNRIEFAELDNVIHMNVSCLEHLRQLKTLRINFQSHENVAIPSCVSNLSIDRLVNYIRIF